MIEAQLRLVVEAIKHTHQQQAELVEVRPEVQQRFVKEVDADMQGTVWTAGGCQSWYLDKTGRNSTLWPSFTFSFMQKARFRPEEYVLSRRRTSGAPKRIKPSPALARVLPLVARVTRGATKSSGVLGPERRRHG
jgi:hypothetical protein